MDGNTIDEEENTINHSFEERHYTMYFVLCFTFFFLHSSIPYLPTPNQWNPIPKNKVQTGPYFLAIICQRQSTKWRRNAAYRSIDEVTSKELQTTWSPEKWYWEQIYNFTLWREKLIINVHGILAFSWVHCSSSRCHGNITVCT